MLEEFHHLREELAAAIGKVDRLRGDLDEAQGEVQEKDVGLVAQVAKLEEAFAAEKKKRSSGSGAAGV